MALPRCPLRALVALADLHGMPVLASAATLGIRAKTQMLEPQPEWDSGCMSLNLKAMHGLFSLR